MLTANAAKLAVVLAIAMGSAKAQGFTPVSQETIWGGNERILFVERGAVRKIQGVVTPAGSDEGWRDVLVEVYDHPEVNLLPYSSRKVAQKRLAGCKTDKLGHFGFALHPGRYEVRLSYNSAMDVTSIVVTVSHSPFASRKMLRTVLYPGT